LRNLRERVHWYDRGIYGRIILGWIFRSGCGGMDWIGLAQDRDRWWALVNAVVNFRVQNNFWNSYKLVSFSRRTYSME
jgi:hypothetical protein